MSRPRLRPAAALAALAVAALVAAGCMTSADAITGRAWKLVEIGGAAPAVEAGLGLEVDGRYSVRPGCNSGGGTYTINGNRITFGVAAITAMACGEPADGQEQAFLGVLGSTPAFEVETQTGRLRLKGAAGDLVFVAP